MRSLGWALTNVTGALTKRGYRTQTQGARHVTVETEIGVLLLQAKEPQSASSHRKPGEGPGADSRTASEEPALRHLDVALRPPDCATVHFCCSRGPVCGARSQQP